MKGFIIHYFFFLLFILSFIVSGVVESQDGLQYLAVARNIYYNHEPTAPPYEYGKDNGWKNIHMSTHVGSNGKTYSLTGLGFSLAMLPSVAITDIVYRHFNIQPPVHFPLENDWLIFLTTSFINIFFASLLGVIIFLYQKEIGVKRRNALVVSLLTIFTTNILAFSKHITAHMMFTSLLFTSFFFIKKYFNTYQKRFLLLFGIIYGIVIITYNNTFLLSAPVIVIYYLLLLKPRINLSTLKKIIEDVLYIALGIFPFTYLYIWFENLRKAGPYAYSSVSFMSYWARNRIAAVPITVFFEGLWGQLFSPGRSIFIYSPLLIIPIIFWFKLNKKTLPEIITFYLLVVIYIIFYATQFMQGTSEQGFVGLWPGESSWGPRYLSPLIPFGMLLVGFIYQKLSKVQKLFTVLPLVIIGTYIEIIGITMPYQIKYHYLEKNFFINYTEYNVYTYVNLLPRYSPIIMMTKNLYHLIKNFRRTTIPETYNVKMYDGISFAFDVGHERWRSIYNTGYIYFDNFKNDQISKISFDLINHPLSDTKEPLLLGFEINGQKIKSDITTIKITERKRVTLDTSNIKILPENNLLVIKAIYKTNNIINDNKQIAGIINMWINKTPINKELIRVPYVDQIGSKVVNAKYANWGNTAKDPWIYWDLHTQVYERTLDFWWIKPIYYWDFPKKPFLILFIFNVLGLGGSTYFLIKSLNFSHPKRSSAKRG